MRISFSGNCCTLMMQAAWSICACYLSLILVPFWEKILFLGLHYNCFFCFNRTMFSCFHLIYVMHIERSIVLDLHECYFLYQAKIWAEFPYILNAILNHLFWNDLKSNIWTKTNRLAIVFHIYYIKSFVEEWRILIVSR